MPSTKANVRIKALKLISEETVTVRRSVGSPHSVFFLGLELGSIRPLPLGWGWRLRSGDRAYLTQQDAAIAFTNWVLRRFWNQFREKIEKKL
jgi:hypothetical protein